MLPTASPSPPRLRIGAVLAAACLLAVACDGDKGEGYRPRQPAASPTGADSRLVALVGTLSGIDSWRGEEAFEGADVAVQILNRRLDDGETPFELVSFDDRGDGNRAVSLVEAAAAEERTVGVVYAGPPEGLPDAESALADAGIPAVLTYGDLYGAQALSQHVFQASPPYRWQARRIAAYLVNDRRYERVGALVEGAPDGSTAGLALEEGLRLAEARPPVLEVYSGGAESFSGQLHRLEKARVEAVVVHGDPGAFERVLEAFENGGATYRDTDSARTASAPRRIRRRRGRPWRPQIVGFDLAIAPREVDLVPGTVAAESYARGAHYLPVPSLRRFREAFSDWWDAPPTGWEQRSYDAVLAIGWASRTAEAGADLAARLEALRGARFGGLDITLGPDDHTFVETTTVGLWVTPSPGANVRERDELPDSLPWVPLARGFSIDAERTDVLDRDWKHLFTRAPVKGAPAPPLTRMKYGVATGRRDPIH